VLACAVTVPLASGCAASDSLTKAQYIAELRAVIAEVEEVSKLPSRLLQAQSVAQARLLLGDALQGYDEIVSRLEDVTPPDEVADLHDRLVGALSGFRDEFAQAEEAIDSGDLSALLGIPEAASQFSAEFADLSQEFSERGYDTGQPTIEPVAQPPGQGK
jgi:hypothetical protein